MALRIDSPNDSICTFAHDVLNVVLLTDIKGDLTGASRIRGVRARHDALDRTALAAVESVQMFGVGGVEKG